MGSVEIDLLLSLKKSDMIILWLDTKRQFPYDGTFSGFQRQPNARSIQKNLEKTLLRLNSGTYNVTVRRSGSYRWVFMPMDKLSTSIYQAGSEKLRLV